MGKRKVVTQEIDNPEWEPGRDGAQDNPKTVSVKVVVSNDPVGRMYRKGNLTEAQKATCDHFYRIYILSGKANGKGVDPTRPYVDCGKSVMGLPNGRLDAMKALEELRYEIGTDYIRILSLVAGEGHSVREATAKVMVPCNPAAADFTFYGRYFRLAVDAAGRFWGYIGSST